MSNGVLHIQDVQGPKKDGSEKAKLTEVEQEIFKCQVMVERGLSANHSMITDFIWENKLDTKSAWGRFFPSSKNGLTASKIKSMNSNSRSVSMNLGLKG
ncbi:40S ribosomal protein S5-1 [Hordeum vulgare]|nr:40S ribosomal protein S5-1 [Hordeum vulgare]